MTEPRTEAGKRLLDTDRDDYSLKLAYLTDAVLAIEAEATAAAEQRLPLDLEVPTHDHDSYMHAHGDARHIHRFDTPPSAPPRQGEPVDVERVARLRRDFVAVAEQRNEAQAELLRLRRLIVSYADLTHRVVQEGGDWREITAEWSIVVAEARAALSEPAEAGAVCPACERAHPWG